MEPGKGVEIILTGGSGCDRLMGVVFSNAGCCMLSSSGGRCGRDFRAKDPEWNSWDAWNAIPVMWMLFSFLFYEVAKAVSMESPAGNVVNRRGEFQAGVD